jgi:hypothetical protein
MKRRRLRVRVPPGGADVTAYEHRVGALAAVFDQGLALFAGLNVVPKRSFLTEYSCRIAPACYPKLMTGWFEAMGRLGLPRGVSFHLDFHTIPFHGEDALTEKHYVSKRSRRQKGVLAFLAQDTDKQVFCYANTEIRKADQADEILRFVEFWQQRTGRLPEELIFDSKLTTYANLDQLNRLGIRFITLRRRNAHLLAELASASASAWRRVELKPVSRAYRTSKVLDRRIQLRDYTGPIRQLAITDLGHEQPTLLLTNRLRRGTTGLIDAYAKRMLIENSISDGVDFFHMDALSSAVAMKINCDLQLTLMGSSLYRLLAARIGGGYTTAEFRHIYRDFIQASAASPSHPTPSKSTSANEHTTPTSSPPGSPTPTPPSPGGTAADSNSPSADPATRSSAPGSAAALAPILPISEASRLLGGLGM